MADSGNAAEQCEDKIGKELAMKWYRRDDKDPSFWICKCGNRRKSEAGYSNLTSHIRSAHLPQVQRSPEFAKSILDECCKDICMDLCGRHVPVTVFHCRQ